MKKLNIEYKKKLLETVAFSYGQISLYELVQKEHRHFHPSGELLPSRQDTSITDKMRKVGELIGIPLMDHVIVGGRNKEYFSFLQRGVLPMPKICYCEDYNELDLRATKVAEKKKSR